MRTILLATDFSDAAQNACIYGVKLAKAFNAEVGLLNVYPPAPVPIGETAVFTNLDSIQIEAETQLQNTLIALDPLKQLKVTPLLKEGIPADTITQVANDMKAELIIMGMSRSGKSFRKIFGSTVTSLVSKGPIPVLVIPEGTRYSPMHSIALATDDDVRSDSDPFLVDTLRELAERYQAEVYLVRVAKDKFKEGFELLNRPYRLNKMLRTVHPGYECIEGKDVVEGLSEFVKRYQISMLAMLPHKVSFLEQLFHRSATRAMIFETDIPLLVLPERKKQNVKPRAIIKEMLL